MAWLIGFDGGDCRAVMKALSGYEAVLQAGRRVQDEAHSSPCESGSCDAGLRRASSRPHSKTLSRTQVSQSQKHMINIPNRGAIHGC